MSYSDPQLGEEPYVGYRKVKARKEWPCAFAKQASAGGEPPLCDGTIHVGDEYVDETLAPWTPEYDGDVDDMGRAVYSVVGTLGAWQHTRYHLACEQRAVGYVLYGTPAEHAAEESAEAARAAKEKADREQTEAWAREQRRHVQQLNSRKARREREIARHAGATVLDDHR